MIQIWEIGLGWSLPPSQCGDLKFEACCKRYLYVVCVSLCECIWNMANLPGLMEQKLETKLGLSLIKLMNPL